MAQNPPPESEVARDGDEYMLERNIAASARLNFQFFIWRDTFGFNIHPSIPLPNDENYIAELATGTGIWLIDVSRIQRKAHLHGFDINLEQVPRNKWLPPNISFRTWDVYSDIPDDTAEKYDLIHIRLLGIAVRDGNTGSVFRNVFKMLKPGGHIQWDELDEAHAIIESIDPSVKAPALQQLIGDSYIRTKYDWPGHLAESAKEAGFENARLYHFEDPPEMSRAQGELFMLFFQEYASRLESSGNKEDAVKDRELLKIASQETLGGSIMKIPKIVCVARKPTQETILAENQHHLNPDVYFAKDIGDRLKPEIKDVYRTWSGLEGDELIAHLHRIRDLAWPVAPYPCVGLFSFVLPRLIELPAYNSILARGLKGATILDFGSCFGQNLRIFAAAGIPTENMYATDIKSELWELGLELFRDREKMKATFVQADILDVGEASPLNQLSNKMDIIIACMIIHLFDWDKQVIAIKRLVSLSKPGTIVVGRQCSLAKAQILGRAWGKDIFYHDSSTFKEIWRLVGRETGTLWKVDAMVTPDPRPGSEGLDPENYWLDFAVTREE